MWFCAAAGFHSSGRRGAASGAFLRRRCWLVQQLPRGEGRRHGEGSGSAQEARRTKGEGACLAAADDTGLLRRPSRRPWQPSCQAYIVLVLCVCVKELLPSRGSSASPTAAADSAAVAAACRLDAAAAVLRRFRGERRVTVANRRFPRRRRAHSSPPRSALRPRSHFLDAVCLSGTANGRHGGAARVPVHLRRRRHGVPALGYEDGARRRCVVTAPLRPRLLRSRGTLSADRRPNGPHRRRSPLVPNHRSSSRFITGPLVSRTGRLTSPVISVGLRGH